MKTPQRISIKCLRCECTRTFCWLKEDEIYQCTECEYWTEKEDVEKEDLVEFTGL